MATSYYACDGTVTNIAGGLRCSTTWQTYTPPTPTASSTMELSGELITKANADLLFTAVLTLVVAVVVIKLLIRALNDIF